MKADGNHTVCVKLLFQFCPRDWLEPKAQSLSKFDLQVIAIFKTICVNRLRSQSKSQSQRPKLLTIDKK